MYFCAYARPRRRSVSGSTSPPKKVHRMYIPRNTVFERNVNTAFDNFTFRPIERCANAVHFYRPIEYVYGFNVKNVRFYGVSFVRQRNGTRFVRRIQPETLM